MRWRRGADSPTPLSANLSANLGSHLGALKERAPDASIEFVRRADFRRSLVFGVLAAVALGLGGAKGEVHTKATEPRIYAYAGAAAFLVLGFLAVRSLASQLGFATAVRGGRAAGATVRLISVVIGDLLVIFITLGILDVPVQKLLVGGALTGVVLGIAAQQSLGNIFAGLVLLIARPFVLGDSIRVRYGTWSGQLDGVVVGIGLTYVSLRSDDGLWALPNAGVLAAAVGPRPDVPPQPSGAAVSSANQSLVAAQSAITAATAALSVLPDSGDPVAAGDGAPGRDGVPPQGEPGGMA